MLKAIKELVKNANNRQYNRAALEKYISEEFIAEDGYAEIHVDQSGNDTLFHPMSFGHQMDLSDEFYDYVEKRTEIIPVRYPLRCCIHGSSASAEDCGRVQQILREHYTVRLHDKAWDYRINRYKIFGLALFGIALLCIWFGMSGSESLYSELLSIIASFSLWEAVDFFLLERFSIRAEMLNLAQLLSMEIVFNNPSSD